MARFTPPYPKRIAIIISTDFLCWVPFIVVCALHSLDIIDATPWYSLFSMVILPINSVINPLLYDDVVANALRTPVRSLSARISNSTFFQSTRLWLYPPPTEDITLDGLGIQVGHEDSVHEKETEQKI